MFDRLPQLAEAGELGAMRASSQSRPNGGGPASTGRSVPESGRHARS
ncbi:hypothetical protein [Nonomuraea endophytica]